MFNTIYNQLNTYQYPSNYKQQTLDYNTPTATYTYTNNLPVRFQYNAPLVKPLTPTSQYSRKSQEKSKIGLLNDQIQKSIRTSSRSSRRNRIFPEKNSNHIFQKGISYNPIKYDFKTKSRVILPERNSIFVPPYQSHTFGKKISSSAEKGYVPTQSILNYQLPTVKPYLREPESPLDQIVNRRITNNSKIKIHQKQKPLSSNIEKMNQYKEFKDYEQNRSIEQNFENQVKKYNKSIPKVNSHPIQTFNNKINNSNQDSSNFFDDQNDIQFQNEFKKSVKVEKPVQQKNHIQTNNSLPQKVSGMVQKLDNQEKVIGIAMIVIVLMMLLYQIIK